MIFAFVLGAILFFWFIGTAVTGDAGKGCLWPLAIAAIGFVLFFLVITGMIAKG